MSDRLPSEESQIKFLKILCCPDCYKSLSEDNKCKSCLKVYPEYGGVVAPISDTILQKEIKHTFILKKTLKDKIKNNIPIPDERVWSPKAKKLIKRILIEKNPDTPNTYVVNMGSGVESFYKKIFSSFKSLIRIGIPHSGYVNAYGDAMALPLKSDSVDLFISSSVIEHLSNPEKAVSELFRTVKPGGLVYAEIPFIGAYHMAPNDYQRYTISGIEALFSRHGFFLENKGICSGPVTALVLLIQHAIVEAMPIGSIQFLLRVILTWVFHPLKYLDYFFSRLKWGEYLACNFFYLGRKPA